MVDESISSESHVFLAQDQMCSTQPSMERFYGALLFVDISGFTALSLKLDVESLKNHINDYFSKMLDVIDKWSGDVIKFAGDALYIVWQVNVPVPGFGSERHRISTAKNVLSDPKFLAAAKSSVEKAVNCALEINFSCCNHKIILGENANEAKSRWTKLFNSLPLLLGHQGQQQQTQKPKPITGSSNSEEIAYLNVHSGIGFGLMAGVDIGANDRWEYFLLGDPITQSAMAEGKAAMGDVVVSQIAHSLIHELDNEFIDCCNEELPCGCWQFEGGFFKVTNRAASGKTGATNRKKLSRRRSKSKIKIEEFYLNQELESNEAKLLEDYNEEVDSIVAMMFHSLKKKVFRFISDYNIEIGALNPQLNDMDEKNEFPDDQQDKEDESPIPTFGSQVPFSQSTADSVKVGSPNTEENKQQVTFSTKDGDMSQKSEHSTESGKFSTKGMRKMEKFLVQFVSNQLKPAFVNWLHKCIVDDLVRHTHEAPRKRFEFAAYQRVSILDDFLRSYFFYQGNIIGLTRNLRSSVQFSPARHGSVDFNSLTIENGNYYPNSNAFANQGQNIIKRGTRLSKTQNFLNDVGLSAELRVVTVMFIKIDCLDVSLFVEDDPSESLKVNERKAFASKFNFIQRSSWEESSDSELLSRLEQCMTIICNAFAENDGQLRQFIVDDKGKTWFFCYDYLFDFKFCRNCLYRNIRFERVDGC
jgi:class 3 adenylate cyclase